MARHWTVYHDFINSLEAVWSEGFQCDLCGPDPDELVCDGTALGCRAEKLPEGDFRSSATEPKYPTGRYDSLGTRVLRRFARLLIST